MNKKLQQWARKEKNFKSYEEVVHTKYSQVWKGLDSNQVLWFIKEDQNLPWGDNSKWYKLLRLTELSSLMPEILFHKEQPWSIISSVGELTIRQFSKNHTVSAEIRTEFEHLVEIMSRIQVLLSQVESLKIQGSAAGNSQTGRSLQALISRYRDRWLPQMRSRLIWTQEKEYDWECAIQKAQESLSRGEELPLTWVHGDFHANNICIKDQKVPQLALIDWSESSWSDPWRDQISWSESWKYTIGEDSEWIQSVLNKASLPWIKLLGEEQFKKGRALAEFSYPFWLVDSYALLDGWDRVDKYWLNAFPKSKDNNLSA